MPMFQARLHVAKRAAHRLVVMTAGPLELAISQVDLGSINVGIKQCQRRLSHQST